MADNVGYTPGSGATISADDIGGGVLAQRVKVQYGSDGTGTDVDATHGLPTASGYSEFSGSASANNTDLVSQDVSAYRWVSVHLTGTFTATVSFQASNDGSNWVTCYLQSITANNPGVSSTTTSTNALYAGPLGARYFRARVTSYTSGTVSAIVGFSTRVAVPAVTTIGTSVSSLDVTGASFSLGDGTNTAHVRAGAMGMGYNGSSWDRLRTPTTFKTATATASGDTALWTPTSGKKFRLQRYVIQVTQDAAQSSGGDIDILLRDSTTATGVGFSVYVPGTAATTFGAGASSEWVDLGNGILSAAANNVLNINLSAALTAGKVRVVACGTEE